MPRVLGKQAEELKVVSIKIHKFIDELPSRWCQDAFARNTAGKPVTPEDSSAVSWSLGALIKKCYGKHEDQVKARSRILAAVDEKTITDFNDRRGMTVDQMIQFLRELDL